MRVGVVFDGFRVDQVLLLSGGSVVVLGYFLDGSVEPNNHNILRLDSEGRVVWRVKRDEGSTEMTFGNLRRAAERGETDVNAGFLSGIEPFMAFVLEYPDGSRNIDPRTGNPPDVAPWQPGCIVRVHSFSGWPYVLDIERGVATNTSPGPIRPW